MTSKVELNNSIDVQSTNWKGSIPIMLSLAPSSLSSPTMPPPVHHMISRQTYLHIALENEVRRFHEYAPIVVNFQSIQQSSVDDDDDDHDGNGDDNENHGDGVEKEKKEDGNRNNDKKKDEKKNNKDKNNSNDNNNDPYPICWFEDEETGTPLRWHFFAGILFDLLKLKRRRNSSSNSNFLPWKIRVHYTSYPDSILPFHNEDVTHVIFQHYLNSLKQALYIQHNSNRIVKNMTKQSHLQIWDGIKRSQFEVYKEIAIGLNGGGSSSSNSNSNSSSNSNNDNSTSTSGGDDSSSSNDITLENVPIRVLVDHRPAFARPCNCYHEDKSMMTVGDILHEWLPYLFTSNADTNNNNGNDDGDDNNIDSPKCYWSVQGIQVPLATSISDLWKSLCHPDRFLYIIIVTNI